MNLSIPFKRFLSISVSLAQVLSTSFVNLSAADLRPRNHIRPLGNDVLAPQMSSAANGRDVVNIVNPNSDGISHNKYESFDIAKDNGAILNNSQEDGVSVTGGYTGANPNLSSSAKLIINEIISTKNTSLDGTLEVFGKNADIVIANENGLIVNGATFINAGGVTLTTGLIDDINAQISVRQGNVSILGRGVGIDGDYFSIISRSMQLSGNISKINEGVVDKVNFIAGLNDVNLESSMRNPIIKTSLQSDLEKPKFSIDANMLGSMYAGYINFVSTEDGMGVRHSGIIKSASDIIIDAKGNISTSALMAQNIDLKTSGDINNEGIVIADKNLEIQAQSLSNQVNVNTEVTKKLGLGLKDSYIQGENVGLKLQNLNNDGKIIGLNTLYLTAIVSQSVFENNANMVSKDMQIQSGTFKNNGRISSNTLKLEANSIQIRKDSNVVADKLVLFAHDFSNNGIVRVNNLNAQSMDSFSNYGDFFSNTIVLEVKKFLNIKNIQSNNFSVQTEHADNQKGASIISVNANISAKNFQNSGLINANNLDMKLADKGLNLGQIQANSLKIVTKDFMNQGEVSANNTTFQTDTFVNRGFFKTGNFESDIQNFINTSEFGVYNANLNVGRLKNTGKIDGQNQIFLSFKDLSKPLFEVLDNRSGSLQSNNILSIRTGLVNIDDSLGKIAANKRFLIESTSDITIKKNFSTIGSIGFKAARILNNTNTLLASQQDINLDSKIFLNNKKGYVFGNNITITSDKITNQEDSVIDARSKLFLKADTIENNTGVIHSIGDMNISARVLHNNAKTLGRIDKIMRPERKISFWNNDDYYHVLWDQRTFELKYTSFNFENHLQNKQAVIKSGGNLFISFESKNTNVHNNSSIIAAAKNIDIVGDVYNTTAQTSFMAWDKLNEIGIRDMASITVVNARWDVSIFKPTDLVYWAENSTTYYSREGYWKLLQLMGQEDTTFNHLMTKIYGEGWIRSNPTLLNQRANRGAQISFTPKNVAQIIGGDNITIRGGVVYNSVGSIQKIKTDIASIQTSLKGIQNFDSSKAQEVSQMNPNLINSQNIDSAKNLNPKITSKKEIFHSAGLSEEQILELGSGLLFYASNTQLNSKISYYIETRPGLVDMNKFYGSEYFFSKIGYVADKPISIIGDAYYENRLLNEQLTRNLGYNNAFDSNDIKGFLDNAASEQKSLGLVIGKALSDEQISKLKKDIVWYVNKKIQGQDVLVPQVFYSKNTALKKNSVLESSTIVSSGDLFLNVGVLQNQSSDILGLGFVAIKAQGSVQNIGGVILGDEINIQAKDFLSKSQVDIDKFGNLQTVRQAKVSAKQDISIQTWQNIKIQNSFIESNGKDSKVNLISKNGLIEILDDTIKKTQFTQEKKETSDSFWTSTTMIQESLSSGSKITAANINLKAQEDITIKGSSLFQTSKEGSINMISNENINILAGAIDTNVKNLTEFSGMNTATNMYEYSTATQTDSVFHQALGTLIEASGNIHMKSEKNLTLKSSKITSEGKTSLFADGKMNILDTQNTSTLDSSYTSYQIFGVKAGSEKQVTSTSSSSLIKGKEGLVINSQGDIQIRGSSLEGKDLILKTQGELKIEAAKNTFEQKSTSYSLGIVGSANAGMIGNQVLAGFGINEGENFAQAQSNFDTKTLSSGKIQMDSLASADFGLSFGYNSQNLHSTRYTNSSIKSSGDLMMVAQGNMDIGGANFDSARDIVLQAQSIQSSKYVNETATNSTGFDISIKQKINATSSIVDTANMVSNIATNAVDGKNINPAIVSAQVVGATTNLIFGDLIGGVSVQEVSFQATHQESVKNSENITHINAGGKALIQSTKGNIELSGVELNANSLVLNSAQDIFIKSAKSSHEESGFSVGAQARVQESAGYSALWGANTDIGLGGDVSASYNKKNETTHKNSEFNIKNEAVVVSKNDLSMIGGRINAKTADLDVGGNLHIVSMVDSKDSKNFQANLGGDVSLGVASNTLGKADISLNGGVGYYSDSSKSVGEQSGIVVDGKLNVNIKGNASLEGAVLDSKTKNGSFDVGGKLEILDVALYQNTQGGKASLSGGMSGDFGGQINIADFKDEKSLLHSMINISTSAKKGVFINKSEASIKDISTDNTKTETILSNFSFAGGDISFSGDAHKIKKAFSPKSKPTHLVSDGHGESNVIYSGPAKPLHFETIVARQENLLSAPIPKKDIQNMTSKEFPPSQNNESKDILVQHTQNPQEVNLALPSFKDIKNDLELSLVDRVLVPDFAQIQQAGNSLESNVILKSSELSWMNHLSDSKTEETSNFPQNSIEGKKLGLGSYGEAYLVNHEGLDYVVKVPTRPEYLANLNKEAQILNSIPQYPNIVKTEGVKDIQGQQGLVLEYIQGSTLDNVLSSLKDAYNDNTISHSEFFGSVSHLTQGVLKGINHLGSNGIVHSDIKGNNILFDSNTHQPKIIDFGLARRVGDEARAGHPLFASPEVLDSMLGISNLQRADTKQDVYAIGQFVHKMGEGQNHVFGVNAQADPLEYAMKKKINKLHEDNTFDTYQPLTKQDQSGSKEFGKYGYEGAYTQFVNNALAIDPNKRLSASDLLNSDFIQDPLIESYELPTVLQKAKIYLGGFETIIQGHYSEQAQQLNFAPNEIVLPKTMDISQKESYDRVIALNPASQIKHIPTENNNLQMPSKATPNFGNVSLIYGVDEARETLKDAVSNKEFDKRPLVVNDYLYALNNEDRLNEFSQALQEDSHLNPYIQKIIDYRVSDRYPELKRVNEIPKEDNLKLLNQLISSTEGKKTFTDIYDKNFQMGSILEKAFDNNMERLIMAIGDKDGTDGLSMEEKELYRQYMDLENKTYQEDFFFQKSKNILSNVFSDGGKIYFSLDGVVNEIKGGIVGNEIKMQNLKEVFNPEDKNYGSITSRELRDIYENYKENPNLKFFIKDHIIENPLKNLFEESKTTLDTPSLDSNLGDVLLDLNAKSLEIHHLPVANHKNLESLLQGQPNFSNVALIYGVGESREILLKAVPPEEMKKRPLLADDYLQALNPGVDDDRNERFHDFAYSVAQEQPNLFKDVILDYKAIVKNLRNEGVNAIPREDNQKVFESLVSDKDSVNILKNIDMNKRTLEQIRQVSQERGFKQLLDFIDNKTADVVSSIPEENYLKDLYIRHITANDEERFFGAKTINILKNVLDAGGKIYFNLDKIVTDYYPYTDRVSNVDLTRLKNIFNPADEYYESITAEELRYVYGAYRDHPNLKFMIKKQVIENPFKQPEVIENIEFQRNQ